MPSIFTTETYWAIASIASHENKNAQSLEVLPTLYSSNPLIGFSPLRNESPSAMTTAPKPHLPSAKPPKPSIVLLITLSGLALLFGLGLGGTAVGVYSIRADRRLEHSDHLTALERAAEKRQRKAQLERSQDSAVWINNASYDPNVTYQVSGVTKTEVPVLVGFERDTAVCVGTLGPDGFIQNPNHEICLSY